MKFDFKKIITSSPIMSYSIFLWALVLIEVLFQFSTNTSPIGFVAVTVRRFVLDFYSNLWPFNDKLGGTNWMEVLSTSITYLSFISLLGIISFCVSMLSSNLELWYEKTLIHRTRKWIVKFRNMFLLPLYCHFLDYSITYYFKFPTRVVAFFLFEPAIILFDIKMGTALFVWVLVHFLSGFYNIYLDYGYFQEHSLSIMNKKNYMNLMILFLVVTASFAFSLNTGLLFESAKNIVY